MGRRRSFGAIRRLPSKRYQASYAGPDLQRHTAPVTFSSAADAETWLVDERRLIEAGGWTPPARRAALAAAPQPEPLTLERFAALWLNDLELRPATRRDYDSLLKNHISLPLGAILVSDLTKPMVRAWWNGLDASKPRARSKAFQLLHNIMAGAVEFEVIDTNPVVLPRRTRIRSKRAKKIEPLTVRQLNQLANAMPPRLRMAVLLGCWCALRYGELSELRRSDVDMSAGTLKISRGVVKVKGAYLVGETKTDAGLRTVHVPPVLAGDLALHLASHVGSEPDALLFPAPNGGHLHSSSFARAFHTAAVVAGRPDATPHTLRHTGASLATSAGATTADVMARLGHSTPTMAMHYQHSLDGADERVARKLSQMAEAASEP
jgi:integrase